MKTSAAVKKAFVEEVRGAEILPAPPPDSLVLEYVAVRERQRRASREAESAKKLGDSLQEKLLAIMGSQAALSAAGYTLTVGGQNARLSYLELVDGTRIPLDDVVSVRAQARHAIPRDEIAGLHSGSSAWRRLEVRSETS